MDKVSPSDYWFLYEYIDSEFNKKLEKIKVKISGNEMEKETKYYVEYLTQDTNWSKKITIDIYKFLINCEYIKFFIIMYIKWRKDDGSNSSSRTLIIPRLPHSRKMDLSQFQLNTETQTTTQCLVCRNGKNTIIIRYDEGKEKFFVFYTC